MFDIGGGSTEVMIGDGLRLQHAVSAAVGTIHPTELFLTDDPVTPVAVARASAWIRDRLAEAEVQPVLATCRHLVGIGGTAATLAAVDLGRWRGAGGLLQGRLVTTATVERQIELYSRLPVACRRGLPGLPPDRADVILAGALITREVLRLGSADAFPVSAHDLRQGLLEDRFGAGSSLVTGSEGSELDPP